MKPSLPKGTRDFSPAEMAGRNFILRTIRTVYERHGYLPLETPAMENLSVLEGKYGEEGDKLLFRVLNSGPVFAGLEGAACDIRFPDVAEKGLRYDLTVPFARYVVMHRNELTFPFKRYQIQPVWRADRPQKGRYREFYQCDADVIGSDSLLNEAEMAEMIGEAFHALGLRVVTRVNNRKILTGLSEKLGGRFADLTVALDKLDKAGPDKLREELLEKGFAKNSVHALEKLLAQPAIGLLDAVTEYLAGSETGLRGIQEMKDVLQYAHMASFDLSLARGLDYYTGTIFEVKAGEPGTSFKGSLLGGGRYDDLTGIFGMPGISGVGISFGIDRIYDVLQELDRLTSRAADTPATQVLFVNFGDAAIKACLTLARGLRETGLRVEMYPDAVKIKKQMSYADARKIPFVVLAGSEELAMGKWTVKDMRTGVQEALSETALKSKIIDG